MLGNSVSITGTVKRSAEAARIREGLSILDFTLCVATDGSDRPTYVDCRATPDSGEACDYVVEGERIRVDGSLSFRTYTNSRGHRKSGLIVLAEEMEFLDEEEAR